MAKAVAFYTKHIPNRYGYGPVYTIWLGEEPTVIVTDYEIMRDLFVKEGDVYAGRNFLVDLFKTFSADLHMDTDFAIRIRIYPWGQYPYPFVSVRLLSHIHPRISADISVFSQNGQPG
uniref:Uncharacterized protein n=1 Tax=Meloidogyne incognita TaxID=6306 RepID=A0A914NKG8_MELIC